MGHFEGLNENGAKSILLDNSCWSGFLFLVGFLSVFRTSQAYVRFWEGCASIHHMQVEWYDACSSLIAFTRTSKAEVDVVDHFKHTLVRLFSMLHGLALAEIEDVCNEDENEAVAFTYELVDPGGLDTESLKAIHSCHQKVQLMFQWINSIVVENIDTGVLRIPPPVLSRAFQSLTNGMVAFRQGMMISQIPFPFPYAQVCEWLLVLHWVCTPLVVSQYVSTPLWGALFSFLQVFVYWSLNYIAVEIENPFGTDANDLDAHSLQAEMNSHLLLLLESATNRLPSLAPAECRREVASLAELWGLLAQEESLVVERWQQRRSVDPARINKAKEKDRQKILQLDRPFTPSISSRPGYQSMGPESDQLEVEMNAVEDEEEPLGPEFSRSSAESCSRVAPCTSLQLPESSGRPTSPKKSTLAVRCYSDGRGSQRSDAGVGRIGSSPEENSGRPTSDKKNALAVRCYSDGRGSQHPDGRVDRIGSCPEDQAKQVVHAESELEYKEEMLIDATLLQADFAPLQQMSIPVKPLPSFTLESRAAGQHQNL